MYNNGLICSAKVDGKILREDQETVYIPFGSEFSLYFKNQESRAVVVKVEIDGTDVLDGDELYISGNSTLDLERFMEKGNNESGRRFRFIQKTQKISEFRGDKIDDGFIRIKYTFEKPRPEYNPRIRHPYGGRRRFEDNFLGGVRRRSKGIATPAVMDSYSSDNTKGFRNVTCSSVGGMEMLGCSVDCQSFDSQEIQSDEGITVKGSKSDQQFRTVSCGPLEENSHTMILRLKGETKKKGNLVLKPITVKEKIQCTTCGKKWSSVNEYCGRCGTALKD